jgi:hypothetical protein
MKTESPKGLSKSTADTAAEGQARRAFLKRAGRFAAVTPPAITLLLGTSLSTRAIASSSGSDSDYGSGSGSDSGSGDTWPGYGWGDKNHIHSGPPGKQ